jgi:hypothetical protein
MLKAAWKFGIKYFESFLAFVILITVVGIFLHYYHFGGEESLPDAIAPIESE